MWRNGFGHRRTDAANALKLGQRAERTQAVSVGDDPRRERRSDARQTLDFVGRRDIEVDRTTRKTW